MKNRLLLIALSVLAFTSAQAREGFYAGGELGAGFLCQVPSKQQLREDYKTQSTKSDKSRLLGGFLGGYTWDINEEWTLSAQAGFRYVQKAKFSAAGGQTAAGQQLAYQNGGVYISSNSVISAPTITINDTTYTQAEFNAIRSQYTSSSSTTQGTAPTNRVEASHQLKIVDLLAVAGWHFSPVWDMQVKAGAAVVMDRIKFNSIVANTTSTGVSTNPQAKSLTRIRPEVGIGLGYWINENVRVSLDSSYIFGKRSRANTYASFSKIPSIATASVSLQYMF